jgi:hypothetical protein
LHQPGVDIAFVLEDLFEFSDRVAYRLFGSGSFRLERGTRSPRKATPPVGRALFEADGLVSVHVQLQVTGIFRVSQGCLAERWGVVAMKL